MFLLLAIATLSSYVHCSLLLLLRVGVEGNIPCILCKRVSYVSVWIGLCFNLFFYLDRFMCVSSNKIQITLCNWWHCNLQQVDKNSHSKRARECCWSWKGMQIGWSGAIQFSAPCYLLLDPKCISSLFENNIYYFIKHLLIITFSKDLLKKCDNKFRIWKYLLLLIYKLRNKFIIVLK